MTRKERYLKALRGEQTDQLVWAPNFDWWHQVNTRNNTVPKEYQGLSCNDTIRAIGGTIWRRCGTYRTKVNGIKTASETKGNKSYTRTITPVGELTTVHIQASEMSGAWFLKEHAVKSVADLRPLLYIIEATRYEPDYEPAFQALQEVGEDGVCLTGIPAVPYIQFAKIDVGYAEAFYIMADYPEEVEQVLKAYHKKFLEIACLVADSPVELVTNGDNMDYWTCPPKAFLKYAVPYYHSVADILHPKGKIVQGHWCGRTEILLPYVPDCGLDVIEAIVPRPMSDLDIAEALDICQGTAEGESRPKGRKVVIQGGVPSVLMCQEGGTREDLEKYITELLEQVGHRPGFILGMADNVPANADFHRVRLISDLVEDYNNRVRPARMQALPDSAEACPRL